MDVGIGLPNAVPGTTGAQLVEWAQRADATAEDADAVQGYLSA